MRRGWTASAAALALLASCSFTPSTASDGSRGPASAVTASVHEDPDPDRALPGGGRILFQDDEFDGDFGIVEADGTVHDFDQPRRAFPYWDPADERRVLMVPFESGQARSVVPFGDRLVDVEMWRLESGLFSSFTRDGRRIIANLFNERGRMDAEHIDVIDRRTGDVVRQSTNAHTANALDMLDVPTLTALDLPLERPWTRIADLVASPDLRSFAGELYPSRTPPLIGVWRRSGDRVAVIARTQRNVSIPTWSPDGRRVAVIVRGPEPDGHRSASLLVHDIRTGVTRMIARPVSDAFWASWSPDGRWLLVDDWTRGRWLFVDADGDRVVPYPSLGNMPRWCCPSSPPIEVRYPVC